MDDVSQRCSYDSVPEVWVLEGEWKMGKEEGPLKRTNIFGISMAKARIERRTPTPRMGRTLGSLPRLLVSRASLAGLSFYPELRK